MYIKKRKEYDSSCKIVVEAYKVKMTFQLVIVNLKYVMIQSDKSKVGSQIDTDVYNKCHFYLK